MSTGGHIPSKLDARVPVKSLLNHEECKKSSDYYRTAKDYETLPNNPKVMYGDGPLILALLGKRELCLSDTDSDDTSDETMTCSRDTKHIKTASESSPSLANTEPRNKNSTIYATEYNEERSNYDFKASDELASNSVGSNLERSRNNHLRQLSTSEMSSSETKQLNDRPLLYVTNSTARKIIDSGRYRCKHCTYGTDREDDILTHSRWHEILQQSIRREEGDYNNFKRPFPINNNLNNNNAMALSSELRKPLSSSEIRFSNDGLIKLRPTTTEEIGRPAENVSSINNNSEYSGGGSFLSNDDTSLKEKHGYRCYKCPAILSRRYCLKRHMLLHGNDAPYKCSQCDFAVKTFSSLIQHEKYQHRLSSDQLSTKKSLSAADQRSNSDENNNNRRVNDDGEQNLNKYHHYRQEENVSSINNNSRKNATSEYSVGSFLSNDDMSLKEKHGYRCYKCPAILSSRYCLKRHTLLHGNDAPYKCSRCDLAVKTFLCLKRHEKFQHQLSSDQLSTKKSLSADQRSNSDNNRRVNDDGEENLNKYYHRQF